MRGLAILLAPIAACSPSGESPQGREPAAIVTAASTGGGDCAIRWNGAPVSQAALLENGLTVNRVFFEREERRRDPPGEHHEFGDVLPTVRVEAARGLPYSCFGPALRTLERGGFTDVVLRPAGEQAPGRRAYFASSLPRSDRRYAAIVRLAAGGRMTWNGEAVDRDGLRRRIRAMDGRTLDDVAVAPSAETDFITLYEAIRVVGQERIGQHEMMPTLSGCAGTAGPVRDPPIC